MNEPKNGWQDHRVSPEPFPILQRDTYSVETRLVDTPGEWYGLGFRVLLAQQSVAKLVEDEPCVLQILTMAAAHSRIEGGWSAYIGASVEEDHGQAARDVALHGQRLPEEIARSIFNQFGDMEYRK